MKDLGIDMVLIRITWNISRSMIAHFQASTFKMTLKQWKFSKSKIIPFLSLPNFIQNLFQEHLDRTRF